MKKFNKKSLALLISVALLLTFTVSGTVAYLVAGSEKVTNTFGPATVDTIIREDVAAGSKGNIRVFNQNIDTNIPVYVRVAVVGNWVTETGEIVEPWTPVTQTLHPDWSSAGGFYYYSKVLNRNEETSPVFTNEITQDDMPEGAHHLEVMVVHQAIQSAGWPAGITTAQQAFAEATK